MTAAPDEFVAAVDLVIAARDGGLLDDSTSDGRFARRLTDADATQRDVPAVRHFAWLVLGRRPDLCDQLGVAFWQVLDAEEPPGYDVSQVQAALGVAAKRDAVRARPTGPDDPWMLEPLPPEVRRKVPRQVCVGPDGQLGVSFPYDEAAKDELKLIRGRTWMAERKTWWCPIGEWPLVRRFADHHRLEISPHADAAMTAAEAAGIGTDDEAKYHLFVNDDNTHVVYRAGYVPQVDDAFLALGTGTFKKKTRTRPIGEWWVPAEDADKVDLLAKRFGLLAHPSVEVILRRWIVEAAEMRRLSHALDLDDGTEFDVPNVVRPLFGYQKAAALYAQRAGFRTFIADEPGVGKSAAAIAACELYDQWPIVVVCPAKAVTGWQREIAAVFPHRTTLRLRGQKPRPPGPADFYIVGWPNLSFWIEQLFLLEPQGAILDESQMAKSGKSLRTRAAKALSNVGTRELPVKKLAELPGAPVPITGLHLNLTGTYMMNKGDEIVSQLQMLHRIDDLGGPKVVRHFTHSDDPFVLAEWHELIRSKCYIRRKKRDVLQDLPDKLRTWLWVEPDPAVMVEYREAEENLAEYLRRKAYEHAAELGLDPESAEVMAAMRAGGASHLQLINVCRQLSAKAKLPAAKEWAQEFLAGSEESLLVYGHHRPIVDTMAKSLGASRIWGGMTDVQTDVVIDRFQAKTDRACVLSIAAAGVAITLTAASTGLFLEQAWNPPTLGQAEDRMHRVGQKDQVTCLYMCAEGTFDQDMLDLIEQKRKMIDAATDGGDVDNWNPGEADDPEVVMKAKGSIAGDLIERLTRRALGVAPAAEPDAMALL